MKVDKILGIDQSSSTGYAVIDKGNLLAHGKKTFEGNWEEKVSQIKEYVNALIQEHSPDLVAIENIQYQSNQDTYRKLAELKGVLENLLFELPLPYTIVSSNTWKSRLNIKKTGRATEKKAAQEFVEKKFSVKVTQDEADAICIAYTAWIDNQDKKIKKRQWA